MAGKNSYLAIDLGTTNSVAAYGTESKNGFKMNIIEAERKTESDPRDRKKVLPSAVFYTTGKNGEPMIYVGDYAKSHYGLTVNRVAKSVKSLMGIQKTVNLADSVPDKTPEEVSARILEHLYKEAKKRLFLADSEEPGDVVITVPASYSYKQCKAVEEAAKLAGINVDNEHDMLLYEPKAVIYNFLHMLEQGEIPQNVLDLSHDKNVMVFDLGGGTLDVSLYQVGNRENDMLFIKEKGISRYTEIGGDDFDELIARNLLRRFEDNWGITVPVKRYEEVMPHFVVLAERLKQDFSEMVHNASENNVELPEDTTVMVTAMNVFDGYSYDDDIRKDEFEEMIRPLLGEGYIFEDWKRIGNMKEGEMNHIIFPILDVLEKAKDDNHVDAVILNGGMTKFYAIYNRIRDFFGLEPLVNSDPDLAVAQGAVYYHYLLHKYQVKKSDIYDRLKQKPEEENKNAAYFTSGIMNDAVNIGLDGAYVKKLLEAGTALPFVSEDLVGQFVTAGYGDEFVVEIYLGRGKDKNLPNTKVSAELVKFKYKYPAGTPISARFMIDPMRLITMEFWPQQYPTDKVRIRLSGMEDLEAEQYRKILRPTVVSGQRLIAQMELNQLRSMQEGMSGPKKKKAKLKQQWEKFTATVHRITHAVNPEDFADPMLNMIQETKQSNRIRATLYNIAGSIGNTWTEEQQCALYKICQEHFTEESSMIVQNDAVLQYARVYMDRYEQWHDLTHAV